MKYIEQILIYFFPFLLLKRTSWEQIWKKQEKDEFLFSIRVFFGLAAIVYVLHYFTVDRSEGLAPSSLWLNYRFGMAGIALSCLTFYSVPILHQIKYYKIPALLACAIFCYFQTRTIIWYPKVPYLYSFAFVLISAIVIRSAIFNSLFYAIGLLLLIAPVLKEAGQTGGMIFSASVVTLIFIIYMKAKYVSELRLFIANQKNFDTQKKIIEINLEFTNQIKSFLPGEIASRLTHYVQEQRMSVLQATDEVLRPRTTKITCLFSDVRGFTKGVGDLRGYVSQSLLPNLKASTMAVERFHGISRKIGDLIFAYYDSENQDENIINVVKSAVEMSNINNEMNQQLPKEFMVRRFILISGGDAVVGNLSGYDSTIEITAIGKPVNCLSRIDEITKNKALRENLIEGDIMITPEMIPDLLKVFPGLDLSLISLSAMGLKIRDFEEIEELYLIPITKKNFQIIFNSPQNMSRMFVGEAA